MPIHSAWTWPSFRVIVTVLPLSLPSIFSILSQPDVEAGVQPAQCDSSPLRIFHCRMTSSTVMSVPSSHLASGRNL